MNLWRTWIFPVLRILIFAAIAAALVKIAFFADPEAAAPEEPSGELTNPTIQVMTGSVYNNVLVSGSVAPRPLVELKAKGNGVVSKIYKGDGKSVKKDERVLQIKEEVFTETGVSTRWHYVTASTAGTVKLEVIIGQPVTAGDAIGGVDRGTFHVSGTVSPEMLFRLLELPKTASITVYGGPAPFDCTGLRLVSTDAGTNAECNVPGSVRIFAGLMAEISIPAGVAEDVLVLPTTAVEGSAEFGNVWVVLPDGGTEIRPVTLGLNDGSMVEIVDGLVEGETVLQFVPGADALPDFPIDPGFPIEPGIPEPMPIEPMPIEPRPMEPDMPIEGDGPQLFIGEGGAVENLKR